MPSGRKSLKEELALKQRYSDLSEKVFKFYTECLDGDNIENKKWASEQVNKALVKMLPQDMDVTSNGNSLTIQWLQSPTSPEIGLTNSTPQQNAG